MSINNKNPQVIVDLPLTGCDLALQDLAVAMGTLPWMEKAWGRAQAVTQKSTSDLAETIGKPWKYYISNPVVYVGESQYYEVVPNDRFKSFSFWGVTSPQSAMDQANGSVGTNSLFYTDVYCVVWVDLKKIDNTKDYIFTQDLIKDVLLKLKRKSSFTLTKIFDENMDDIYRGFTLQPIHRDLLMYPHAAFRIEGKLNYSIKLC